MKKYLFQKQKNKKNIVKQAETKFRVFLRKDDNIFTSSACVTFCLLLKRKWDWCQDGKLNEC